MSTLTTASRFDATVLDALNGGATDELQLPFDGFPGRFATAASAAIACVEEQGWTVHRSHHNRVFVLRKDERELILILLKDESGFQGYRLASSGPLQLSDDDVLAIRRNLGQLKARQHPDTDGLSDLERQLKMKKLFTIQAKRLALASLEQRLQLTSEEEPWLYTGKLLQMEVRRDRARFLLLRPAVSGEEQRPVPDLQLLRVQHTRTLLAAKRAEVRQVVTALEELASTGSANRYYGPGSMIRGAGFGIGLLMRAVGEACAAHRAVHGYDAVSTRLSDEGHQECDALFARMVNAIRALTGQTLPYFEERPLNVGDVAEIQSRLVGLPLDFPEAARNFIDARAEQ